MILVVYASRVDGGRLLTRKIFTSDAEPDDVVMDDDDATFHFFGCDLTYRPLFQPCDAFSPEMHFHMDTSNETVILVSFNLFVNNYGYGDIARMDSKEFLRYLDLGIPW